MKVKMKIKKFESYEGNVWKYTFEFKNAITEAVLYKYEDFSKRTVLCISVQSGCPVGCTFCGTGSKFIRNLTHEEICKQVFHVLRDNKIISNNSLASLEIVPEKFQIMFMSMGEPFLNYNEVKKSIEELHQYFPAADLLISTIAPNKPEEMRDFIELSKRIEKVGLQFSIHKSYDLARHEIIPYRNKLSLNEIRNYGIQWWHETGRKPYCNYCIDGENNTHLDCNNLMDRFPPNVFNFTFSVVCSANETMKDAAFRELDVIKEFESSFLSNGYDTRVFNPAGQDDIGGGCGQLWYVQKWIKDNIHD
jgi:23S rRNA (adenine2503-C2)-methyltransferase